jgi:uncharacterized protein YfiM (DUF2279 family)
MRIFLFCFATLVFHEITLAQPADSLSPVINRKRMKFVFIASGTAYIGAMIALNEVWYSKSSRSAFHFFNDSQEWKQMDKVGHIYSAFQLTSISYQTFQWSGLSKTKADRLAAISSFGIMASIEVLDGFSSAYGASIADVAANTAGIGLFFGQQLLWKDIRIHPKFSFHQTSFASMRPNTLGANFYQEFIKDYNGQTEWLSFDIDKFVKFPKWLNVAVGYGIEGMIYANDLPNKEIGLNPYRQLYLALDLDLSGYKSRSKLWNSFIYILNMIKLPAPTLEFSKGRIHGHYLYF